MNEGRESKLLYDSIVCSEKTRGIQRLPRSMQEEFLARLEAEGIMLSKDGGGDRRCLADLMNVSDKVLAESGENVKRLGQLIRKGAPETKINEELESVDVAFSLLGKLLRVAGSSANTEAYMSFLARPCFGIESILDFMTTVDIFTNGRKIVFEEVPVRDRKHGENIIKLIDTKTDDALDELIATIAKDILGRMGDIPGATDLERKRKAVKRTFRIATLLWKDARKIREKYGFPNGFEIEKTVFTLLDDDRLTGGAKLVPWYFAPYGIYRSDAGRLFSFERHFEKGVLKGYVVGKTGKSEMQRLWKRKTRGVTIGTDILVCQEPRSKGDFIVQHELQHLFDNLIVAKEDAVTGEYRAMLAELAFSNKPEERYEKMNKVFENILSPDFDITNLSVHGKARIRVIKAIESSSIEDIPEVALKRLNEEYRQNFNLTYAEIIDPFVNAWGKPAEQLWNAIRAADLVGIALAINRGADVNERNKYEFTPLLSAVCVGQGVEIEVMPIVELLVDAEADVNVRDRKGFTALRYARQSGQREVAEFLKKHGAKE